MYEWKKNYKLCRQKKNEVKNFINIAYLWQKIFKDKDIYQGI